MPTSPETSSSPSEANHSATTEQIIEQQSGSLEDKTSDLDLDKLTSPRMFGLGSQEVVADAKEEIAQTQNGKGIIAILLRLIVVLLQQVNHPTSNVASSSKEKPATAPENQSKHEREAAVPTAAVDHLTDTRYRTGYAPGVPGCAS